MDHRRALDRPPGPDPAAVEAEAKARLVTLARGLAAKVDACPADWFADGPVLAAALLLQEALDAAVRHATDRVTSPD